MHEVTSRPGRDQVLCPGDDGSQRAKGRVSPVESRVSWRKGRPHGGALWETKPPPPPLGEEGAL